MSDVQHKFIGDLEIYPNQEEAANNIVTNFIDGSRHNSLIAGFQEGKTGTILYAIDRLCTYFGEMDQNLRVIYVIGIGLDALREQTQNRCAQAGLNVEVVIYTELGGINIIPKQPILLVVDEAHAGIGQNSEMAQFMAKIGIDLSAHPRDWDNTDIMVLTTSATHYAQVASLCNRKPEERSEYAQIVRIPRSESYLSMEKLRDEQGRLEAAFDLKDGKTISKTFRDHLNLYIDLFPSRPSIFYVRPKLTEIDAIMGFIRSEFGNKLDVRLFSDYDKNLPEFEKILMARPARPMVCILKLGYGAGQTLRTRYIYAVYENYTAKENDTHLQRVGRFCGYNKSNEKYKIYCNLAEIAAYIKWYNEFTNGIPEHCPTSRFITTHTRYKYLATPVIYNGNELTIEQGENEYREYWSGLTLEQMISIEPSIVTIQDALEARRAKYPDAWKPLLSFSTVSGVGSTNNAQNILDDHPPRTYGVAYNKDVDRYYVTRMKVDGPYKGNRFTGRGDPLDSWNELKVTKGNLIGKIIDFKIIGQSKSSPVKCIYNGIPGDNAELNDDNESNRNFKNIRVNYSRRDRNFQVRLRKSYLLSRPDINFEGLGTAGAIKGKEILQANELTRLRNLDKLADRW